jgi:hypothetical protein
MNRTGRVVRVARRRMTAGALIDGAGRGLAWGAAAGLVLVGGSRLVAMPWEWWWLAGVPMLAGGAVGALLSLRLRRSMLDAAGEVDRRLRLKDRLSTGTALGTAGVSGGSAFQTLAVEEADRASDGVDPRRAVPLVWGRAWGVWPALVAVTIGIGVWAPAMDLMGAARRRETEQAKARDAVARKLAEATKLSQTESPPLAPKPGTLERPENTVLRDIEKELASGKIDPSRAAERGARELEKVAAEREKSAASEEKAHDDLRDTIAKMNAAAAKGERGEDGKLGDALRSGDLGEAAQAAREMMNASPEQTTDGRARAAAELEKLAKELREAEKAKQAAQQGLEPSRDRSRGESEKTGSQEPGRASEADRHLQGEQRPQPPSDSERSSDGDNTAKTQGRDRSSEAYELAKAMERAAEDLRGRPEQERPKDGNANRSTESTPPGSPQNGERKEQSPPRNTGNKPDAGTDAPKQQSSTGERPEPAGAQSQSQPTKPRDTKESGQKGAAGSKPQDGGKPEKPNSGDGEQHAKPKSEQGEQRQNGQPGERGAEKDSQKANEGTPSNSTDSRGERSGEQRPQQGAETKPSDANKGESASGQKGDQPTKEPGDSGKQNADPSSDPAKQGDGQQPKQDSPSTNKPDAKGGPSQAGQPTKKKQGELTKPESGGPKDSGHEPSEQPAPKEQPTKGTEPAPTKDAKGGTPTPRDPSAGTQGEHPTPKESDPNGKQSEPSGQQPPSEQQGQAAKPSSKQDAKGGAPEQRTPSAEGQGQKTKPEDGKPGGDGRESSGIQPGTMPTEGASPRGDDASQEPKSPKSGADGASTKQGEQKPRAGDQKSAQGDKSDSSKDQPSGTQPEPGDKNVPPQQPGEGLKQLADRLEQLSRQPQNSQQTRKQADELRKQAQEMLKNATPEQREQAKRWAQEMAKKQRPRDYPRPGDGSDAQPPTKDDFPGSGGDDPLARATGKNGGPFGKRTSDASRDAQTQPKGRTDTVDARPPTSAQRREKSQERVIAEWYADKKPERGERDTRLLTPDAERTVREAVRDGEHALDTEAVPSRYDTLLRKYFQRLGERAKSGNDTGGAAKPTASTRPAEPAQDAPTRPAATPSHPAPSNQSPSNQAP